MVIPFEHLETEQTNNRSVDLDRLSSLEIVQCMNKEDQIVAPAVGACLSEIAKAIDLITERMSKGGRLIYVGAGTSGKLGSLDAYEFPLTFGIDPSFVQAICAGVGISEYCSPEEAEDDDALGANDMRHLQVTFADVVVGITASGRTPYVMGALIYSRGVGAGTIGLACNKKSQIGGIVDVAIEIAVGQEVLTGSTRLKAGSAQKMVLNMLSTGAMVRMGKVYRNCMVNLKPSNEKLRTRAKVMIQQLTGANKETVASVYEQSGNDVGVSVVMLKVGVAADAAMELMRLGHGNIREALQLACTAEGQEP